MNKIVGTSFEDMTISEMMQVQGSGDVEARTTPACLYSLFVTANVSSAGCIGATAGIIYSIVRC